MALDKEKWNDYEYILKIRNAIKVCKLEPNKEENFEQLDELIRNLFKEGEDDDVL